MHAVTQSYGHAPTFVPSCPGGKGGSGKPVPYLAELGITDIEILRPSWTEYLTHKGKVIGRHHVRAGQAPKPYTQSLTKSAYDVFGAHPSVLHIEAPTVTAHYVQHGRERWFACDFKVRSKPGSHAFIGLGAYTDDFFVHVQPCRFADSCDLTAGITALRMGTGLSVILLNEMELRDRRMEVFHA